MEKGRGLVADIIDPVGRAHFCFWIRDDRSHTIPATFVVLLCFLLVALMTLSGSGTSVVASAIYSIYLLVAITLAASAVFVRTYRIITSQVVVLVEAYVVALFITSLLLSHNIFFPIAYFSVDAGVQRTSEIQALIAYAYSLPAIVYLGIRSQQVVRRRMRRAFSKLNSVAHFDELVGVGNAQRTEAFIWSAFHYALIGALVWSLLFASSGNLSVLNNALSNFKWF
jgi:hypothetical protein